MNRRRTESMLDGHSDWTGYGMLYWDKPINAARHNAQDRERNRRRKKRDELRKAAEESGRATSKGGDGTGSGGERPGA